jgi:uncharacterized protein
LLLSVSAFPRDRVVDNAGVLSAAERIAIAALIDSVAEAHNFDMVIVTEANIGNKSPRTFADGFFDDNGYGLGNGRDGCVFLQVTESRDMYFSTSGRGIKILNPAARNKLESNTVKSLKKGENYAAYRAFVLGWDKFLKLEAKGRSYNAINEAHIVLMLIAWLVAFVIGLIVVHAWKQGMNTVKEQTQAASYIVSGSLDFAVKKDSFLYSTTTKVKRDAPSSASTAGTAVAAAMAAGKLGAHISSSGNRHGGGGRKY